MIFRLLTEAIAVIREYRARDCTLERQVQADFEEAVREYHRTH